MKKHFGYLVQGIKGKHGNSFMGCLGFILAILFLLMPLGVHGELPKSIIFPLMGFWFLWVIYSDGKTIITKKA